MITAMAISAIITPTVHQRTRYSAAGADRSQKRTRSLMRVSLVPVIRPRAAATRAETSTMSSGSGAPVRMRERCPAEAR